MAKLKGGSRVYGSLQVDGTLTDSSGDVGTSGQLLSSTATGTSWVDAPSGGSSAMKVAIYKDPTGNENFNSTTASRISNIDVASSFNDSIYSESGGIYTINETGVYEVNIEFCLRGTAGSNYRYTGQLDMRLNSDSGTLLARIEDGYIRRSSGAEETAYNLHTIESFTSGDDFRFTMRRLSTVTGAAVTIADTCRVMIKQLST